MQIAWRFEKWESSGESLYMFYIFACQMKNI
jgi:hypothetical protein